MTEPFFVARGAGLTLREIARVAGARADDSAPLDSLRVFDVAAPERAGRADITFAETADAAALTQAAACLVTEANAKRVSGCPLIVADPYRAFVAVANALFPGAALPSSLVDMTGIAPSAFVHPAARLEAGVLVDPAAVIGPQAEIGGGTVIGPLATIGRGVRIGRHCAVGAGASVSNALIGDRVTIQAGARLGQPGLSSADKDRPDLPPLGRVIVQDGVEIGANATIDRGSAGDTVIGEGSRVDNLVRIGRNVMIGRKCIVARAAGGTGTHKAVMGPIVPDESYIVETQLSA
jgi:UDP-3-O-[3-hydroxymyristoyl] glucosamine N-acyltransferase